MEKTCILRAWSVEILPQTSVPAEITITKGQISEILFSEAPRAKSHPFAVAYKEIAVVMWLCGTQSYFGEIFFSGYIKNSLNYELDYKVYWRSLPSCILFVTSTISPFSFLFLFSLHESWPSYAAD